MDIARLQTISAFTNLSDHDLRQIALLASELSIPEGKDIVKEGDWSNDVLGIVEGTAVVTHDGETVAELGAGDVIGEIGVMGNVRRGATVTATSPMFLIALDSLDIKRLRKTAPEVVERLSAIVDTRTDASGDAG